MDDTRTAITELTVHMRKMKVLLGDWSTGKCTPNIIAPKHLKHYLGQKTKILIGKCTKKTSYIRGKLDMVY